MAPTRAAIVIPARLESSRLPRKVLADIHGYPMLWHVYHRASKAQEVQDVLVATDSVEIRDVVQSWGGNVIMTSSDCTCGTERIASIVDELDCELVVNVQGDEPLIEPDLVDELVRVAARTKADMVTPVTKILDTETLTSSDTVKVVRDKNGFALYFSRAAVPFVRALPVSEWIHQADHWLQIGTYVFSKKTLQEYREWDESPLEKLEKVEQFRFLENCKRILTIETDLQAVAVDVPEDLERVRKHLAEK